MTKATSIQRELTNDKDAVIGKHVIVAFLRRRNIKMMAKQRSKKKSKKEKVQPLQKWHATYRERCLRTQPNDRYDEKWGRFLPSERLNVDQSPLPFVMDAKKTYEFVELGKGHEHNTWISQPGKRFHYIYHLLCSIILFSTLKNSEPLYFYSFFDVQFVRQINIIPPFFIGSGLEKRQCSLQVMFRPKGKQPPLGIIFR